MPQCGNAGGRVGPPASFEGEVALGVEAHRALAQVGGADARQLVVDDDQLAVDVDAFAVEPRHYGVEDAQPRVQIRPTQRVEETGAQDAHGASSSQSHCSRGVTTITSGPAGSRSLATRASAIRSDVRYWFSM